MSRLRRPDPELAAALCVVREERGISREELALRCGIAAETLARIEGAELVPAWIVVRRLVTALGVGWVEVGAAVRAERDDRAAVHGGARRRREPGDRPRPRR